MNHVETADPGKRTRLIFGSTMAVLALGLLLRTIIPESDPYYSIWTGYITDEGRWTGQARNLVLFGSMDIDDWLSFIHLAFAPLFQALTTISFALFGVNFTSARLISILCGCAVLIFSYLFLRRRFTADALFLSILALSLQPDLLFLSRVAIPEMPAMLFELLAFAALVSAPHTSLKAALAGLFTLAALGMKATVAPIVPIFLIILVFMRHENNSTAHWRRAGAYLGVLAAPAIVVLLAAVFLLDSTALEDILEKFLVLKLFLQPASLYSILSFLFYGDTVFPLNFLLLGAWLMAGLLIAAGRLPSTSVTVIYIGSAIWIAGWFAVSAGLVYFPPRYIFHALIPIILNLGAGLTLLQIPGRSGIQMTLASVSGARRMVAFVWLSLPIAVLLCPAVIGIADLAGFSIDRFREQLPLLLVLCALVTLLLHGKRWTGITGLSLVVFPLIVTWLWFAGFQAGVIDEAFWDAGAESLLSWVSLLAIAGMVSFLFGRIHHRAGMIRRFGYVYLVASAGLWMSQGLPGLVNPSYTVAEASADLVQFSDNESGFYSGAAASLFLNNSLHYSREVGEVEDFDKQQLPEILVVAFGKVNQKLLEYYDLVHQRDFRIAGEPYPEPILKIYRLK